ncbi:hypothetical protein BGP_0759 [Beggiatoa sp. PS]|nr:hypothetical protein BGP_0759 [Beggiatoa sp. PS]
MQLYHHCPSCANNCLIIKGFHIKMVLFSIEFEIFYHIKKATWHKMPKKFSNSVNSDSDYVVRFDYYV